MFVFFLVYLVYSEKVKEFSSIFGTAKKKPVPKNGLFFALWFILSPRWCGNSCTGIWKGLQSPEGRL